MNRRKFIINGAALAVMGGMIPVWLEQERRPIEEYSLGKTKKAGGVELNSDIRTVVNSIQPHCKEVGFLGVSALAVLLNKPVPIVMLYGDTSNPLPIRRAVAAMKVDYIPTTGLDSNQIQFGYKGARYALAMTRPELLTQAAALVSSRRASAFAHDRLIYNHTAGRVWDPCRAFQGGDTLIKILSPRISIEDQTKDLLAAELIKNQMNLGFDSATTSYVAGVSGKRITNISDAEVALSLLVKHLPDLERVKKEEDLVAFASQPIFSSAHEVMFKDGQNLREKYETIKSRSTHPACSSAIILASLLGGKSGTQPSKGSINKLDQNLLKLFLTNNKSNIALDANSQIMLKQAHGLFA